ncbi:MAG: hypothetical protein LBJ31_11285 [Treponema sp.]|nr:hypothetical protein [Treponema sp.]
MKLYLSAGILILVMYLYHQFSGLNVKTITSILFLAVISDITLIFEMTKNKTMWIEDIGKVLCIIGTLFLVWIILLNRRDPTKKILAKCLFYIIAYAVFLKIFSGTIFFYLGTSFNISIGFIGIVIIQIFIILFLI